MGGINPMIPLQVQPVQAPDPLAVSARAQGLANMYTQAAMQRQALSAGALELEQKQQDMADQQKLRQAWLDADGDLEKMQGLALQRGVGPRTMTAIQQAVTTQKEALAKLKGEDLKNRQTANEMLGGLLAPVLGETDPDKQRTLWDQQSAVAIDRGLAKAGEIPPYPGADGVRVYAASLKTHQQLLDEARAQASLATAGARQVQAETAAAREQREAALAPSAQKEAAAKASLAEATAAGKAPIQPYQQTLMEQAKAQFEQAKARFAEQTRHNKAMEAKPSAILVGQNDAATVAQGIADGTIPPDINLRTGSGIRVAAEAKKLGVDVSTRQKDWTAIKRHISTLNGPQQLRLRQAVNFTYDSLDVIEQLFNEWKSLGRASGMPLLNKANLAIAKNLPGRAGAVATSLEAQINDLTSELGTVYKGGNSSTDESLKLAAENLKANWNSEQFHAQLDNIRRNLRIRRDSINNAEPQGVSPGSVYNPKPAPGSPRPAAPADPLGIR